MATAITLRLAIWKPCHLQELSPGGRVPAIRVSLSLTWAILTLCASAGPLAAQRFEDQTAARFPSPAPAEFTNQLTIVDIDGDLDLDLVFANGGNFSTAGTPQAQRIYVNDGSGTFTDETAARLSFAGLCRGVEAGDIDGDGDFDLLFVQDFDRQPRLFVNDGAGVFSDETATQMPVLALSSARGQFLDIDDDGDLDLYIASGVDNRFGCGQNRILVNDGTGVFTDETATRHPTVSLCENMDVSVADVDGDFDLDVLVGNRATNESRLFVNDGAGVFTTGPTLPAHSSTYSFDFGDVDGDGDLDVLGANSRSGSSGEALWLNDGAGTFTDASSQLSPNPGSDDDNDSKFFDLDDDGDLDLVIAALSAGAEKIYTNDGAGHFTQAAGLITAVADSTLDLMVADLTGDDRFDLVTAQGESGSFVNRIYVDTTGPADSRPPRILATGARADAVAGRYVLHAAIVDDMSSDRGFFDRGVELSYQVDGGAAQMAAMRHSGGQIYRAEIDGVADGSTVTYTVSARDFANNLATSPERSFTAGPLFADGFETGDTAAWSAVVGAEL
jgi:hypothetical protein